MSTGTSAAPACAKESGFIPKSSVLPCPAVGQAPCVTAVSHCCPPQRQQEQTVQGGSQLLHTVPPPQGLFAFMSPGVEQPKDMGNGDRRWRVHGRGCGRWLWAVQLSPAAPGAGVGMVPELQRGLTEPGRHSWTLAWGLAVAVKVTPKLREGSLEVLCHWIVSVHMDPSGKGCLFCPADHS